MAKISGKVTKAIVVGVVLALVVGVLYFVLSGDDRRKVSADFDEGIGIYPGTPVRILGVDVGEVTKVTPEGDHVRVEMEYETQYKVPPNAGAVEVANSLVSDRFIQLTPAYKGTGPTLADGAHIPLNRTASPAELDDIYGALSDLAKALGPNGANKNGALSALLQVSAANLKGNGAPISQSIQKLSQAAQTLNNNKGDLFSTVRNLQAFTKTLADSDSAVRHFEEQLATVAGNLADERGDLGQALRQLGLALDDVATFVRANAGKFHTTLKGLEGVTRILLNQKASLTETLAVAPVALANIVHAYQPDLGVIATRGNLASLTDPGQLCRALQINNLLTKGLLGNLLNTVVKTCDQIVSQLGTNSAGHTKLGKDTMDPAQLVPLVHAIADRDPVGGLITGGGK